MCAERSGAPTTHGRDAQTRKTLDAFLTPEAMLTPGVAGALTMMITNALAVNFEMERAWTGLALSFVFGLLVLVAAKSLIEKAVYYVLNSLVIFCVAAGANGIGVQQKIAGLDPIGSAWAEGSRMANDATVKYCIEALQAAGSNPPASLTDLCASYLKNEYGASLSDLKSVDPNAGTKAVQPRFFSPWKF